jgi:hypothetical protein
MEELDVPNSGFVRNAVDSFVSPNNNNLFAFVTVATIVPGTFLLPIGLLITGWAAQEHVFWLVTDIVSDLDCVLSTEVLRDIHRVLPPGIPDRCIYTARCFWWDICLTQIGFQFACLHIF